MLSAKPVLATGHSLYSAIPTSTRVFYESFTNKNKELQVQQWVIDLSLALGGVIAGILGVVSIYTMF